MIQRNPGMQMTWSGVTTYVSMYLSEHRYVARGKTQQQIHGKIKIEYTRTAQCALFFSDATRFPRGGLHVLCTKGPLWM